MRPFLLLPAVLAAGLTHAGAQVSTIDPGNPHAWSQNTGWIRMRYDSNAATGGIVVREYFLSGRAWSQNTGWIDFGSGFPHNNIRYGNSLTSDCGVNHNGAGDLSGYAWSQNAGWINFGWAAPADALRPRISLATGAFSGMAWGQNIGWINLATGLATQSIDPHDGDGDGMDDSWETEWLTKPTLADAFTDRDGDGRTDLDEFLAGTNPADASSYLDFLSLHLDDGGEIERLTIPSSPTRFYRVSRSVDLDTWDDGPWQPGEPGTLLFKEALKPSSDLRVFFKVSARRPLAP